MSSVPVLLYHHVAPDREITPPGFEAQLRWLAGNGFHFLSTKELFDHLTARRPAEPKSVALTFDDGYADNWVYAFPLLRKYSARAVVFVVTGRVGDRKGLRPTSDEGGAITDTVSGERSEDGFLRWEELRAMSDSGLVEIGSHTHTHRGFDRGSSYQDVLEELRASRREIEDRLGAWPAALAWPWGDYRPEWLKLLPAENYRLAFTTTVGSNAPGTDPLAVRRFKVRREGLPWLSRRLWIYRRPLLAAAFGRFYGLDQKLKSAF